jgi:WD40 repeat protein
LLPSFVALAFCLGQLALPAGIAGEDKKPPKEAELIRTDLNGDPLPAGAVVRMGTARLHHPTRLECVAFSPDGKELASLGDEESIRIWEAATGRPLREIAIGSDRAECFVFSPDGNTIATGSYRGTILLLDAKTGGDQRDLLGHKRGVRALAFSPDGKILASAGSDKTIRLWEPGTASQIRILTGHQDAVNSVAFSPDGKALASGGWDRTVRLWDVATGKEVRTFQGCKGQSKESAVNCVVFSPDGKRLAAGSQGEEFGEGTVVFWDVATGKELPPLRGYTKERHVFSIAFSPDGRHLAVGGFDTSLCLWDPHTGKQVHELGPNCVTSVRFSPKGETLASGDLSGNIRLWDPTTGKERPLPIGDRYSLQTVAVSPAGKTAATLGEARVIRVWEAATGKHLCQLTAENSSWSSCPSLLFLPDGHTLVEARDNKNLTFWDTRTGKQVRKIHHKAGEIVSFTTSPDGKRIAVWSWKKDSAIALLEVSTGKALREVEVPHDSRWRNAKIVARIGVAPEANILAASRGRTIQLWKLHTGDKLRSFRASEDEVAALAFSPDGKLLASGEKEEWYSGSHSTRWDWTVRVWDASTGKAVLSIAQKRQCNSITFSPDGRLLAAASKYGSIRIWEVMTGQQLLQLSDTWSHANSLAFLPDRGHLASAMSDGTALIWELKPSGWAKPKGPLGAKELAALWADLGGTDAEKAFRAVCTLAAAPTEAVPFLAQRLHAIPRLKEEVIAGLIADLGHESFPRREAAHKLLLRVRIQAETALRKALAQTKSLEVRNRIKSIVRSLEGWLIKNPETLRNLRSVWALERSGTKEARQLLQKLAEGAPEARLTQAAQQALNHLARR